MALSQKFKDNEVILVDSFGLTVPKTADAKKMLTAIAKNKGFERLATKKKNAAMVAISEKSEASYKSFRNIGNVNCVVASDLNPVSVLRSTYLILENPESVVSTIAARGKKRAATKEKVEAK